MGFFKKRIEKEMRERAEAGVARAEAGDDPVERTLGPGGEERVQGMMAGLERFGIHLDADDALGTAPKAPRGYKEPVEGSMHVVGATQLDPSQLRAPCHITYVIQAEGVEPFSGETEVECWTRQWPTPGEDLPVVFDRRHPQKVHIQWDRITSHADSARMHADQLAAELRGGDAGTVVTPIVVGDADPERIKEA